MRKSNYEEAPEFAGPAYTVTRWGSGIAWRVLGWETEPDEDTQWSGYETRTGRLVMHMVGDDVSFSIDPEDVCPLKREDYCGECGQVGCSHDGLDRSTAETNQTQTRG
jgi:hypothetical protein